MSEILTLRFTAFNFSKVFNYLDFLLKINHILTHYRHISEQPLALYSVTLTSMCEAVLVATNMVLDIAVAVAAASLGDFDNLQADQLDLGAAVLQHLLSGGQHLILHNDTSTNHNSYFFAQLFARSVEMGACFYTHTHTKRSNLNNLKRGSKSTLLTVMKKNTSQRRNARVMCLNVYKCSMTLHITNLGMMILAQRGLISHLLWQWWETSLVAPLHFADPQNTVPLAPRWIH